MMVVLHDRMIDCNYMHGEALDSLQEGFQVGEIEG